MRIIKYKRLKPIRKIHDYRIPISTRFKLFITKDFLLYFKIKRGTLKFNSFIKANYLILILSTIVIAVVVFLLFNLKEYHVPSSQVARMHANLINLNTLLMMNLIWAMIIRYQKLTIPRGGILN